MRNSRPQTEINLGNNHTVGLLEIVLALEGVLGIQADLAFMPEQDRDILQKCADVSKAERLLGYRPGTRLEVGLRRFAECLRSYVAST